MRLTLSPWGLSDRAGLFPVPVSDSAPPAVSNPKNPAIFSHSLPSLLATFVYAV